MAGKTNAPSLYIFFAWKTDPKLRCETTERWLFGGGGFPGGGPSVLMLCRSSFTWLFSLCLTLKNPPGPKGGSKGWSKGWDQAWSSSEQVPEGFLFWPTKRVFCWKNPPLKLGSGGDPGAYGSYGSPYGSMGSNGHPGFAPAPPAPPAPAPPWRSTEANRPPPPPAKGWGKDGVGGGFLFGKASKLGCLRPF